MSCFGYHLDMIAKIPADPNTAFTMGEWNRLPGISTPWAEHA